MFRNFLLLVGLLGVAGVVVYFVNPDFYNKLLTKPAPPPPTAATKFNATLSGFEAKAVSFSSAPDGKTIEMRQAVESEGDGIPAKSTPYLMVVSAERRAIKFFRLTPDVKSITFRPTKDTRSPDAAEMRLVPVTPGGPLQYEVWMPRDQQLNFEFEVAVALIGTASGEALPPAAIATHD